VNWKRKRKAANGGSSWPSTALPTFFRPGDIGMITNPCEPPAIWLVDIRELRRGIAQPPVHDAGGRRHGMRHGVSGIHDVQHLRALRAQRIGDHGAMAS